MQRLRVTFSRGESIKYISHLDITRLWERALRRAGIPLVYSQGFSPHAKLSLAAPLAVGVTSEAELMDIHTMRRVALRYFMRLVGEQLPPGIEIRAVEEVPLAAPALQASVRYAEYRAEVETERNAREVEESLISLIQADHIPWSHHRDTGERSYDLRSLVADVWLEGWHDSCCVLGMRLRNDTAGSGRPEQVTAALGFGARPKSIQRTRLILG